MTAKIIYPLEEWYYLENGFGSLQGMERAHDPIAAMANIYLGHSEMPKTVLDLGCGNGALLQRIQGSTPQVILFGADLSPEKIHHARRLLPRFAANFVVGNIFSHSTLASLPAHLDLILFMPGRLIEVNKRQAEELCAFLTYSAQAILAYAYGDWVRRFDRLFDIVKADGFEMLRSPHVSSSVACAIAIKNCWATTNEVKHFENNCQRGG